jgi:hypothetical protein
MIYRRGLTFFALTALTVGLGLVLVVPAAAEPATTVSYPAGAAATRYSGLAFDTCTAPSLTQMQAWLGQGRNHERVGQADGRQLRHRRLRGYAVEHRLQCAAATVSVSLRGQLAGRAEQAQRTRHLVRACRHAAERRVGLGCVPEGRHQGWYDECVGQAR